MENKKNLHLLLLTFLLTLLSMSNGLRAQTAQEIIDDMILPCDGCLHGTEGLSWGGQCASGLVDAGGQVPRQNNNGEWMQAMTAWGQTYIDCAGSPTTNTRVQYRNLITKFLRNNGTWELVQGPDIPGGAMYVENFANNENKGADIRDESNNGGGISVTVGVGINAGYNYHYYGSGRAFVDVNNIQGVYTSVEARLILDNPNGIDDRAQSRTLNSMGADWWLNMTVGWLPDWSANFGIGGGRNKWVTSNWQTYTMCTETPAQILANPPNGGGGGTYTTIPAKIEAEAYSSMNGIQFETTTDTGGGQNVGYIDAGDYMNYNIRVNSAGTFTVDLRVASQSGGGSLQLKSGSTVLKTVTVPNTGGWQTWTTVNSGNISLGAGDQVIQVYAAAGGWNFNWLDIKTGGPTAPTVSTTTPSSITQTTASSGGNVTADGGASLTARGVCWSTSSNPTTSNSKTSDGTGTFTSSITGLTASTTYYVRAYATNSVGTSYGSDQQFTTSGSAYTTIPAIIQAEAYSSMNGIATETTTDTGGGLNVGWIDAGDYMNYNIRVNSAGTFTVDLRVASQPGGGSLQLKSGSTVLKTVTVPSTGGWQTWTTVNSGNISLGAGDQVIQVYAAAGGWNFNWLQFKTTITTAPTVSTTTPSSITQTTASSGGNVTADGGASVTARGVCWSTSSNPTTANSKTSDGTGTGTFTSSITGLTASTTYHVRAYATNSVGTSYGSDQQFTTSGSVGSKYEAENAALSGGAKVNTDHTGYSGTGFVDGYTTQGPATTFTVNVSATGNYDVTLRYANNKGSAMTVSIYVNGTKIRQTSCPNLPNWDTWGDKIETLSLNSGNNTIAYKYDSGDGGNINIDYISLSSLKSAYIATAIKQPAANMQLMVYPNPLTAGLLNIRIEGQTENAAINIYTLKGQLVYSGLLLKGETMQLGNGVLKSGMYFIKVSNTDINEVQKILVK